MSDPSRAEHSSNAANRRTRRHAAVPYHWVPNGAQTSSSSLTPPNNLSPTRASAGSSPHAASPPQIDANQAYPLGMIAQPAFSNVAVPLSQPPPHVQPHVNHRVVTPIGVPGFDVGHVTATRRHPYGTNIPESRTHRSPSESSGWSVTSPINSTSSHILPTHGRNTAETRADRSAKAAEVKSRLKLSDALKRLRAAMLVVGLQISTKAEDLLKIADYLQNTVPAMQTYIHFLESQLEMQTEGGSSATEHAANAQPGPSNAPDGHYYSFDGQLPEPRHS